MYIRVWNKTAYVNRLNLQYLGLSSKRDDESTIGQFGSGIKYAPILALRKDIDFVFVGKDEDGQYQLTYDTKIEKGIEVVYYDYGTYSVPSSFTIDAGRLSWEDEFQIYREVVSNAKDSAKEESDWGAELADEIKFVDGQFAIYISATREMLDINNNHDYYYCDNAKVLFSNKADSTMQVLENTYGNTVVYCKTVLAHESEEKSLFLYNSNTLKLNEERKLSSFYSAQYDIAQSLIYMDNTDAIDLVLKSVVGNTPLDRESIEFWSFPTGAFEFRKANPVWRDQFYKMFGEKTVLINEVENATSNTRRAIKDRGYIAIVCKSNNLYAVLKSSGVRTVNEIIGEEAQYDLSYDYSNYPNLVTAIAVLNSYENDFHEKMQKKIALFVPSSPEVLGLTINTNQPVSFRQILINANHARTDGVENLVATLVHEYDHYTTGLGDQHSEFRSLADQRIGNLMVSNYQKQVIHFTKDSRDIKIKIADLPYFDGLSFKIQKSEILQGVLLQIGSKTFIVKSNDMANNLVGKLQASEDDQSMSIANALTAPLKNDNIKVQEI